MYVKNIMPSVAAGSACRNEELDASRDGRMDDDLVLDGVIDDRIAAAYAIVELGERDSKKVTAEFAPSELDEELLEVDDLDHYHQVPRSPEYCRKDRAGKYGSRSSADCSPVRTTGRSLVEGQQPRVGHVRGAVMPSRTSGKPMPKLTPAKRRVEDEGSGIKAKLARMLFEKKSSQTDSIEDDEREAEARYSEDEDRPVACQSGRFVRTSMPLLEPVSAISCVHSPARCDQERSKQENLEVRLEQSFSAEEIHRLRESLLKKQSIDESAPSVRSAGHRVSPSRAQRYSPSTSPQNRSEVETSTKDLVIPASSSPSPAFPSAPVGAPTFGNADVLKSSQFPAQIGASEYFTREAAPLADTLRSWPIMSGMPPYYFLGLGHGSEVCEPSVVKTVVPGTGFVQYYVLPGTRPVPNSANPVSSTDFCNLKVNEPMVLKREVDDAMTKLEKFTLGKQLHSGSPSSRPQAVMSHTSNPNWSQAPAAKSFCPQFGSLNSISNYYSIANSPANSPASLEAGLYPSNSAISRSCHDLTRISSKFPTFQDAPNDLPRQSSPDVKYKRPKSNQSVERNCTRRAQRVSKNRRKILPATYALEMVQGGAFGSLAAIRKFYDGLKSRSAPNLSEQKFVEVRERAGSLSQGCGEVTQDFPLDLSSYRRKFSTEVKGCSSELMSFSISEASAPVKVNAVSESLRKQDSHARTGSGQRSSPQQKSNISQLSDTSCVGTTVAKSANPSLASHSVSHILPNSSLPPKKRKLRQSSQSRDFSEVQATMPTTSVGSTAAFLRPVDVRRDPGMARQSSEALRVAQATLSVSPAETGFVLTPEMKLLENKVGIRDEDGDLPLHIAVAKGYLEFVQEVLLPMMSQHGVHIDSCNHQRQTALHLAVITNQPQMVETLLKASASASVCDRKGNSAVHLAVRYRTPVCLRYILSDSRIELDLDAKNYEGLTALHLGVQLGEKDAVRALLANGADPNAMDGTNGRTPLFYAVETNNYTMASVLLKYGSDPCIASYSGCTPLQIATAKSFRDMTNMLERSFPRGLIDQDECFAQQV